MKIIIDYREQSRIKPAIHHYKKHAPTVEDLPTGDYLFNDKVVFEYKTFTDFIGSIVDKRVFNQSISQREAYPYHFVILELGESFNLEKALKKYNNRNGKGRKVYDTQYYGTISRLNTYTTVIPVCGDSYECFRVMLKQAEKCLEDKTLIKYPSVKTANSALNYLCNDVRGVGLVTGENIVDTLKLETLEDLLGLTHDDLIRVTGVGDKTAENIMAKIRKDKRGVS